MAATEADAHTFPLELLTSCSKTALEARRARFQTSSGLAENSVPIPNPGHL